MIISKINEIIKKHPNTTKIEKVFLPMDDHIILVFDHNGVSDVTTIDPWPNCVNYRDVASWIR